MSTSDTSPPPESPESPEPPPLHLRQRAMLLLLLLLVVMLALPFFLIGWGLRGHLHPSMDPTDHPASTEADLESPLRQVLEKSEVLPPPDPLIENESALRFPEWRPPVSSANWHVWQEFLQASAAIRLDDFSENGIPLRQYLIRTEAMSPPPEPAPPFAGPTLILVLPASPPASPATTPSI